ncbi:hypothetical protein AYM39_00325 [Methylomonas sp. DH-1]|nr:hypothetical protein AYM39_00325 [Methylomonas sp. DH-1]
MLNASSGGTFTINFDRDAFANMLGGSASGIAGIFNDRFYNAAESDYTTQSGGALLAGRDNVESDSTNLIHTLTGTSVNSVQATSRHAQATSADFAIDSDSGSFAGTGQLGMLGVQAIGIGATALAGPYAGGGMVYGDYSLKYNSASAYWSLQNNIFFPMEAYALADLALVFTDANNWQLTGNLLLSADNASMLFGTEGANVGTFKLSVGSISAVPVPAAVWMMGSGLLGLLGIARRQAAV